MVQAQLLQHVVERTGASRGCSRAPAGRVDYEDLIHFVVAPLRACITVGLLALLAPLVFLLGLLGLTALCGCVVHALALLAVEDGPHCLLTRSKTSGNVEQLFGVDRWAPPELAHKVSSGRSLEKGVHDFGLSHAQEFGTMLGKVPYEVPE
jgi:hypothetical protein